MTGCNVIINEEVEGLQQRSERYHPVTRWRWVCSCGQADKRAWPNKWQAEDSGALHTRGAAPVVS